MLLVVQAGGVNKVKYRLVKGCKKCWLYTCQSNASLVYSAAHIFKIENTRLFMMQQIRMIILCLGFAYTGFVYAEKPEWAGNGQPTAEQKAAHNDVMNAKEGDSQDDAKDDAKDKMKKDKGEGDAGKSKDEGKTNSGLEKQKDKKAAMEQKEMGKGSEKGQESREDRKKWWKFW